MKQSRKDEIDAFLSVTPWAQAQQSPLPADASHRRYTRLYDMQRGAQALLMDAPPDKEPKTPAFVAVDEALRAAGLSAPEIYEADVPRGLLLLEDFGELSFTNALAKDPGREQHLYAAAGAVITVLDGLSLPGTSPYDACALKKELSLFCEYWWPDAVGSPMPVEAEASFYAAWASPLDILEAAARTRPALTLRDFHADNLFDLPGRPSHAQIGLIDFQDAVIGHAAYDLVSLLQDVRRTVSPDVEAGVLGESETALGDTALRTLYALYGAQRALKNLGIFTRLDTLYNKPAYRRHLARTWHCVMMNLHIPELKPLARWIDEHIPLTMREGLKTS